MVESIPKDYRDLVSDDVRAFAVLAVVRSDGSPHATPVWFDMEGDLIRVNTARGRVKDHAMHTGRPVALTILDPENPYRYMLVEADLAEETEEGAAEHIAHLALKYRGVEEYDITEGMVRVIYKLEPTSIVAN
ncbi:MAG: pyridoxamine 5'-phosphate oxidase family protein [Anaerolineales bacterium]